MDLSNQNKKARTKVEIIDLSAKRWNIWATPKKIKSNKHTLSICPDCKCFLLSSFTLINLKSGQIAKVYGRECSKCRTLFVRDEGLVRHLLKDNTCAKEFTINGEFLFNYSDKKREKKIQKSIEKRRETFIELLREKLEILKQIESSILLVTLKNQSQTIDCVITSKITSNCIPDVLITHYSSFHGREIISGIYRPEKRKRVVVGDKEFHIVGGPFYIKKETKEIFKMLHPSEIDIMEEGGYSTSVKNNQCEIVDLLLFSPYTKKYEIAHATYNKSLDFCYMDIGIYRAFVRKYGNPGVKLLFESRRGTGNFFDYLRTESILKAYGYSVSHSSELTTYARQNILTEIIDLELLSVASIVKYLDFFLQTHSLEKYKGARCKWLEDRDFVSNYQVNVERFLIAR